MLSRYARRPAGSPRTKAKSSGENSTVFTTPSNSRGLRSLVRLICAWLAAWGFISRWVVNSRPWFTAVRDTRALCAPWRTSGESWETRWEDRWAV